jgi:coenzyme F420-reducing hydrogenase delta subunit/Pyruvate/2-oxoacid:ferredoxin oxidoreductase delta subunit
MGPKEVTVVYRRSEKEMPAHKHEVEDAKIEGVKFNFLATPRKILGQEGKVVALECVKNILGVPDESGRRRPVPVEGSEFIIPADSVLLAIGEMPEVTSLPKELTVSRQNRIIVDDVTLQTSLPGVFAGGDNISGPASVIEAITAGKRAAVSIDRYLRGADLKAGRKKKIQHVTWVSDKSTLMEKARQPLRRLTPKERLGCFKEVDLGLTEDSGLIEARRCLFCGGCDECLKPDELCETDDVSVDSDKCIACTNCEKACEFGAIKVEKSVAKVDSFICKGCGTCVIECPAEAITLHEFSDQKISSQLSKAAQSWKKKPTPQTVSFMCNWASDRQNSNFIHPKNMQIIPVRCAGRVDPLHILKAFKLGAEGVLVVSCASKDCHYVLGSSIAEKRVRQVKGWLQAIEMDSHLLQRIESSVGDEKRLSSILKKFADNLEHQAPSSLKTHNIDNIRA